MNRCFSLLVRGRPPELLRNLYLAPPFLVGDYEPIAVKTFRQGKMGEKVEQARAELEACVACPRNCKVNRMEDKKGACNTGRSANVWSEQELEIHPSISLRRKMFERFSCRYAIVSSAFPHFGEESVLQGWNGSGTIFFGMCNLRCVFCQNWDISQKKNGWELKPEEIADLMLKLQNETKCHNINFVTPEHVVPQVIEAIALAVEGGRGAHQQLGVPSLHHRHCFT